MYATWHRLPIVISHGLYCHATTDTSSTPCFPFYSAKSRSFIHYFSYSVCLIQQAITCWYIRIMTRMSSLTALVELSLVFAFLQIRCLLNSVEHQLAHWSEWLASLCFGRQTVSPTGPACGRAHFQWLTVLDIPRKDPAYPIENDFTRARYKAPTTKVLHPAKHYTRSFGILAWHNQMKQMPNLFLTWITFLCNLARKVRQWLICYSMS